MFKLSTKKKVCVGGKGFYDLTLRSTGFGNEISMEDTGSLVISGNINTDRYESLYKSPLLPPHTEMRS